MGAPTLMTEQAKGVLQRINDMVAWSAGHVTGGTITDGGASQSTGTNGTLNFDADVAALHGLIDNVPISQAASTDIDSTAGDPILWGASSGVSVIFAIVMQTGSAGTTAPAFKAVPGAVAADASVVGPTEAQIDTAVGHTHWVLVGDALITRTGATTVTFTASHARRASLGYKVTTVTSPSYTKALAETESEFRDYTTS